jgi:ABC-type uncharacterized transport system auxiliary subunit
MSRHLRLSVVLALLLSAAVSACSVLPPKEVLDVYRLGKTADVVIKPSPGNPVAIIRQGTAVVKFVSISSSAFLDTNNILAIPTGNAIVSYKGSRWTDAAPELFRRRLMERITGHANIYAVDADSGGVEPTLQIGGKLVDFQVEYRAKQPFVHIRFDAEMMDAKTHKLIGMRRFESVDAVDGTSVEHVVETFGSSVDTDAKALAEWIKISMASDDTTLDK